jgi:hypothetical protein
LQLTKSHDGWVFAHLDGSSTSSWPRTPAWFPSAKFDMFNFWTQRRSGDLPKADEAAAMKPGTTTPPAQSMTGGDAGNHITTSTVAANSAPAWSATAGMGANDPSYGAVVERIGEDVCKKCKLPLDECPDIVACVFDSNVFTSNRHATAPRSYTYEAAFAC